MTHTLIGIELPERRAPLPGDFELKPRAIKHWVAALPLADPAEAARAVQAVLAETNALDYPPEQRLAFLSALKPGLAQMTAQLKTRLSVEPFPLGARALQVVELLEQVQREAALGYAVAAETLVSTPGTTREPLAFALLHALRHFGEGVVLAYQARRPDTADAWRPVHLLFRFAEARRVEDYRPPDARRDIVGAYKQLLLLGAADPRRLRHREIGALVNALESYARRAELLACNTELPEEALAFVIDTAEGGEPVRLEGRKEPPSEGCRLLRVDPLVEPLLEDRGPHTAPLLRGLVEHWRRDPHRGAGRIVDERLFELLVGLTPIHAGLLAQGPAELAGEFLHRPEAADEDEPLLPPPNPVQLWRSRDISSGGLRLAWSGEAGSSGMEAGELVALREAGSTTPYHLGVVRWLRGDTPDRLEAGVELLELYPRAVAIRRTQALSQRGLLLGDGIHPEGLLLAPTLLYHTGQEVRLADGTGERQARLGPVVEEMSAHALFALGEPGRPVEGDPFSEV